MGFQKKAIFFRRALKKIEERAVHFFFKSRIPRPTFHIAYRPYILRIIIKFENIGIPTSIWLVSNITLTHRFFHEICL